MDKNKESDLVRRIAKLAKQNQELENQVKELLKENEKLSQDLEKKKTLLANLTPEQRDLEGKLDGRPTSIKFNMATVLFADIHGFNRISSSMDSEALMDELDGIFYQFDSIVKKYNIEKIKTIGDSYMCAGGIPIKNITNPIDVVMAALEM